MIDVTNSGQFCPSIPKSVAKKLLIATKLIKPIDKSETNKTQNYKFQPWNIIQAEVRKALVEAELLCLASVRDHTQVDGETKAGGAQYRHVAWVDVQFVDPDTGECWATTWAGEAFESGDKGLQKAITSAVKYALLKTFHISDKDTKDADAETPEEPAPQASQPDPKEKEAWDWLKSAGFGRDDKAWIENRGMSVFDLVREACENGCKTKPEVVAYFDDGVIPMEQATPPKALELLRSEVEQASKILAKGGLNYSATLAQAKALGITTSEEFMKHCEAQAAAIQHKGAKTA
jgi:hypothetical protein